MSSISDTQIIESVSRMIASSNQSYVERKRLQVAGTFPSRSFVSVTDKVIGVSLDAFKEHLKLLEERKLEIALRVMSLIQGPGSCEAILFNEKVLEAYMRTYASIPTQAPVVIPPVYFGPFERCIEVTQRQYAISTGGVLATWHLADCVAFAGYDKKRGIGFLFHIDEGSDVKDAISHIPDGTYEYILMGNHNSLDLDSSKFIRREAPTRLEIASQHLMQDSYWSRAVRLQRSIAIDLEQDDPLGHIMGYEAELNPHSAIHKREQKLAEADRF